ncbi:MAG: DUF885 domain-containing protein [Elusimicrobia bacterium]|nr:DUF885 domain-containing protein [Elusimicrobiota bacterium]
MSLSAVVADALRDRWESLPLLATFSGARGWDATLGENSLDFVAGRLKAKKELLSRLGRVRPRSLDERLDARVLAGHLRVQVAEIERWRRVEWDASLYPFMVVRSCHILLVKDLPREYRRDCLAARLRQAPVYLAQGLKNLRRPDRRHAELALAACESGIGFMREAVAPLDPRGSELAVRAFAGYAAAVRAEVLPRAVRRYPAGRDLFALKLLEEHGLPYSPEDLAEVGRKAVADTTAELRRLSPSWRADLERIKKRAPGLKDLLNVYRAETRRARRWVRDADIATLPRGERLDVVPTPRFEWDTSPYAALLPPGPFERSRRGQFWVTPVDPSWPAAKRRERLEGHCYAGLSSVCPHEGYPGHHLQLVRSNMIRSEVRRVFTTPVLVEGWALYCEKMVEEEGFSSGRDAALYRLKDQLWRAVRIGVDLGLHVRGWSPERAAGVLVRDALLERENAAAEVSRYCGTPTQPMSYMTGMLELLRLREECRAAWGPRFTLKRFHDAVLDLGGMPPSWMPLP